MHVIRTPVAGRIEASVYRPGQYLNAASPQAPALNEYQGFVIETKDALQIGAVLVAGTVARRIVPSVGQGDSVTAGQRVGIIRFGSRVDIYLPPSASVFAGEGQRTIAGETVIADLEFAGAQAHFPPHLAGLGLRFLWKRKGSKSEKRKAGRSFICPATGTLEQKRPKNAP